MVLGAVLQQYATTNERASGGGRAVIGANLGPRYIQREVAWESYEKRLGRA